MKIAAAHGRGSGSVRQSRQLDRRTAIHDHVQSGGQRPAGGRFVDHPELYPHSTHASPDRLVDVRAGVIGAPEDVDHVTRRITSGCECLAITSDLSMTVAGRPLQRETQGIAVVY